MGLAGEDNQRNLQAIALLALFLSFSSFSVVSLVTKPVACFPGDIGTVKCPLVAGTTYPNPSFWNIPVTYVIGSGICTTSAIYVRGDNGNSVSVTTPSSPPVSNNAVFSPIVFYDFDVHVTLAGTTGKVSLYDSIFGLGTALSREMVVAELGLGGGSGALQMGQNLGLGPGTSDTFDLQIQRTAGTGQVCIDGLEGTAYVLAPGGTPA